MKCPICDSEISEPQFNRDTERWEDCLVCQEVVKDTVASFLDKPAADEDTFGEDRLDEVYFHGIPWAELEIEE